MFTYKTLMLTTDDILQSVWRTGAYNLHHNVDLITDLPTAVEGADYYLENFSSSISRDINSVDDKDQLFQSLVKHQKETAYFLRVLTHYIEETDRQMELDLDEELGLTY